MYEIIRSRVENGHIYLRCPYCNNNLWDDDYYGLDGDGEFIDVECENCCKTSTIIMNIGVDLFIERDIG